MKRLILLAFLAAAALAQPRSGGELRVAIQAEPRTLDPHLASDEPSEIVRYLTAGALVRMNRKTQAPEPDLAVSWKIVAPGRRIRFELRPGASFDTGKAVTPQDVCYSFVRATDPKTDSPNGEALRGVAGAVTCAPAGAGAVELAFEKPLPQPERWMDGIAVVPAGSQPPFPALGPFRVAEVKPGVHVLLARNPKYGRKDAGGRPLPYLDSIRLEIQRNRDFELMRFRRGELHLVNNLDAESFDRVRAAQPQAARNLGVSLDTEQLWFNQVPASPVAAHKKAWFQSRAFRAAVSRAIRRDDMVKVVYRGQASPALSPVSPANRFWHNGKVTPPPADATEALKLLAAEGFRLAGGVLRDRTGQPVEFSIITNAGNKSRERMAALIQQDLTELGMRVTLAPLDFPSLIDRITKSFDYEACLLGLISSELDPNGQMNVWLSSAPNHQWNPNQKQPATAWEAEVDKLMQAQAAEADLKARKRAFDRVQEIAAEQAPFIYLLNRHALVAVSEEVGNADPVVLRPQTMWNAERLYLKAGPRAAR